MGSRQTRFSDVCGTMDELKRLVHEEYERVVSDPAGTLGPLLDDALFMLRRMRTRLKEYARFREDVRDLLSQVDQAEEVDADKASHALERAEECIKSASDGQRLDVGKTDSLAEETRAVASAQEHRLRAQKDVALNLYDLLIRIKGSRPWIVSAEDTESHENSIKRRYQAWLPPEPHCGELLKRLAASRAHVLESDTPDGEPVVQFMDGGSMRMSQIRWNPDIKNFHPASFRPGPTGREYRRTSPGDSS